jgi:hypothetical protein
VKLTDLVTAIYKLLGLKDHHHQGSQALSQRTDITLLTALLTHASKSSHSSSATSNSAGSSASHGPKNAHVQSTPSSHASGPASASGTSPNRTSAAMIQREVLLTIGTMANLIGWFGPLGV